jgi:TolB-like protein
MHKKLFSTTILLFTCAALSFGQGQNYFSGTGGAGESIAVLIPEGRGLAENETYLPTLVQGVLVGDLTKFSAMKVIDRANLEKVIAEGEKDFYADENNFVQLGSIIDVRYVLNGTLQKTASGFSLQLKITEAASGATKAAYTGSAQAAELDNLGAVNKASADLLAQLGITLTRAGKDTLLAAAQSNNIAAETALAKGITAQRSGTIVEALNYYYEASDSDPKLAEAASRLAGLSMRISNGNLGENVRSEIQQRNAWQKLLAETKEYYEEHPFFDIVYYSKPQQGKIDYQKETVAISFPIWFAPNARFDALMKIITSFKNAQNGKNWGLRYDDILGTRVPWNSSCIYFQIESELLDASNNYLAAETSKHQGAWWTKEDDMSLTDGSSGYKTLDFNINANQISDTLSLKFIAIKKVNSMPASGPVRDLSKNVLQNIRLIASDKPYSDYFKGKRGFTWNNADHGWKYTWHQ